MENSTQIRAIVPGHLGKSNTATLRPVTVERLNNEGPIALGNAAVKQAEKTFKGFHAVYSALHVMIALPELEPDPLFDEVWATLNLAPKEKEITLHLHLDENENIKSVDASGLPPNWTYDYESHDPEDDDPPEEDDDPNDINPLGFDVGTPYNNTNHL